MPVPVDLQSPAPASAPRTISADHSAERSPDRSSERSAERGDALFHGREPLAGKIRGHDDALPPEAIRCANCHEAAPATNPGTQRLSRLAPPHLDAALLLEYRQRRGGPPSRYDQPAFCALLRTGVDPAHILVAREMPAYEIDDAQCASLWAYALSKNIAKSAHDAAASANATAKSGANPDARSSANPGVKTEVKSGVTPGATEDPTAKPSETSADKPNANR
jgi:hypothetical protein